MTIPQIKLASIDFSHIEYLPDNDNKRTAKGGVVIEKGEDLKNLNDLGVPII